VSRFPQTARAPGHRAGMTMVEMIVALALFAVVTTVVMSFLTGSRRTYGQTSDRAQYQQSLRAVFSLMTRELRSAGCDPDGPGFTGLTVADDLVIRCRMDLDADGSTLGLNPDEDVAYIYVPAAAELRPPPAPRPSSETYRRSSSTTSTPTAIPCSRPR